MDLHGALGRAIARLQALEPRGVGARDAREALLLQLDPRSADYAMLAHLVEECLDDLATGKRAKVARALGIEAELLEELIGHLATLRLDLEGDDAPGAGIVTPELLIEPAPEGGFELQLVDGALPGVSIDPGLSRLAELRRDDARVRRFLATQLRESRDLAAALESRRRTLLAVAREVFLRQRRFLVDGPSALAPLSRMTSSTFFCLPSASGTPPAALIFSKNISAAFLLEAPTAGISPVSSMFMPIFTASDFCEPQPVGRRTARSRARRRRVLVIGVI